eukprot:scaffold8740_cov113-Cylindrotheca_fusiformis.AAC.9
MESIIPTAEDLFLMIKEVSKPRAKHVRFAPDVSVRTSTHANEDIPERWYSKDEVSAFKLKVQDLTVSIMRGEKVHCNGDNLLGLEHYCDLKRMKHKQLAVEYVLKAQRALKDRQLAKIAHEASAWHREIAFVQGLQDYCAVYDPALASSVPSTKTTPPPLPRFAVASKKRKPSPSFIAAASKRLRTTILSAE